MGSLGRGDNFEVRLMENVASGWQMEGLSTMISWELFKAMDGGSSSILVTCDGQDKDITSLIFRLHLFPMPGDDVVLPPTLSACP